MNLLVEQVNVEGLESVSKFGTIKLPVAVIIEDLEHASNTSEGHGSARQ